MQPAEAHARTCINTGNERGSYVTGHRLTFANTYKPRSLISMANTTGWITPWMLSLPLLLLFALHSPFPAHARPASAFDLLALPGYGGPSSDTQPTTDCSTNAECLRRGRKILRPRVLSGNFGTAMNVYYAYTGGAQQFTAPATNTYVFSVGSGQGGDTNDPYSGYGAGGLGVQINTSLTLTAGTVADIIVGGQGGSSGGPGGGGGGSFIFISGTCYIAAGGGSGAADTNASPGHGMDASTTLGNGDGQNGAGEYGGGGQGGTNGNGGGGGTNGAFNGGGGAGIFSSGQDGADPDNREFSGQGGSSFADGFAGGAGYDSTGRYGGYGGSGGYGGGGGAGTFGSGGGGGYSGGGGGSGDINARYSPGGAGGSYFINAASTPYQIGSHAGDGSVAVYYLAV